MCLSLNRSVHSSWVLEGFADTEGINHFSSKEELQSLSAGHRRGFGGIGLTVNLSVKCLGLGI